MFEAYYKEHYDTAYEIVLIGEGGMLAPTLEARDRIRTMERNPSKEEGEILNKKTGIPLNEISAFSQVMRGDVPEYDVPSSRLHELAHWFEYCGYSREGFVLSSETCREMERVSREKGLALAKVMSYYGFIAKDMLFLHLKAHVR